MNVLLISTYELGHQPFGLASAAAWLRRAGASVVCLDLAVQSFDEAQVRAAGLIGFYVPMHTATRLAASLAARVRRINGDAHLCFFGLYAPMNAPYLRALGGQSILGGEFESGLVALYKELVGGDGHPRNSDWLGSSVSLAKQKFLVPERSDLPALSSYAKLLIGEADERVVGYTEASRGCKHLCRHCPIVPIYGGQFRIVQREVVLEDIRQQVRAGAQHITFGDPDFFNGIGHAVPIVELLHEEFPHLTYDATIKIEHLLKHAKYLPVLRDTGCLFITSAVESIDDEILEILDKGHTRDDFIAAVELLRNVGIGLSPTFIPFAPWTSLDGYIELLSVLDALELVDHVSPVQLVIKLLLPAGSWLLDRPEIHPFIDGFDEAALSHRWSHPDRRLDSLQAALERTVQRGEAHGKARSEIFADIWLLAHAAAGQEAPPLGVAHATASALPVPRMTEPWYCCAEPTEEQFSRV